VIQPLYGRTELDWTGLDVYDARTHLASEWEPLSHSLGRHCHQILHVGVPKPLAYLKCCYLFNQAVCSHPQVLWCPRAGYAHCDAGCMKIRAPPAVTSSTC